MKDFSRPFEEIVRLPPYDLSGSWLKGNLHTHTTRSDGRRTPEQVVDWYRNQGYDFVSITDHDRITLIESPDDLTLIPGAEITVGESAAEAPIHLVALGLEREENLPPPGRGRETVDRLKKSGAAWFVAHPYWSGLTVRELMDLGGGVGLEVFNYGCDYERNRGLSAVHWDQFLTAKGPTYGLATDDSHWELPDYGGGWINLKSPTRNARDILAALRNGHFYSSCGPEIKDLRLRGRTLTVSTSPVKSVFWVGQSRRGWHAHASRGGALTEVRFKLDRKARYFRVEVMDHKGRWAWSQPRFI